MSVHESKASDTDMVDVATNVQAVIGGMQWDANDLNAQAVSAAAAASSASASEYQLSATLDGHDYGVRDVASSGPDTIASIEEKGRASIFVRQSASTWVRQEQFEGRIHQSLAFVIASVEGCRMRTETRSQQGTHVFYPKGTFMTGGGDKAARPFTAHGTFFNALTSHGGPVGSISYTHPNRHVITGAWDGIVRIWNGDELLHTFDKLGHEHGTEVLGLESGNIVTASTTANIIIIDANGRVVRTIAKAHGAPIRKVIAHPLGFATAANDGTVKVWSETGDAIQSIEAVPNTSSVKFLYGLAFIRGGNLLSASVDLEQSRLVTCGEDGVVRIFNAGGRCVQELVHPGPVRSVHVLPQSTDFVTACTDKRVRIFTTAVRRYATEKERNEFVEMGRLVTASGMKALDTSTLEGEEALQKPGTKNGQVKVLNIVGRPTPIAYQWSDDLHEWIEIGEAMGSGPTQGKSKLDGVEYDFVSDIWLDESHKVQLGFNADEDPEEVTARFCALHNIQASDMRQQILDFIRPKCDMSAVAMRKAREASAQAAQVMLQQVPSWTSGSFETYPQANYAAMEAKITQINATLTEQGHAAAITGDELRNFRMFFDNVKDVTQYHSASFTPGEHAIAKKLLQWPTEHALPVLDCFRVLMMHGAANTALLSDSTVQEALFQHVRAGKATGKETYQTLFLKLVSNWIAKRQRHPSERSTPPQVPPEVLSFVDRVLEEVADCASSQSEPLALAYVMLLHNLICWFGRLKVAESELYLQVATGLCELLNHKRGQKIQFYALLTFGSIAYASPAARDDLKPILPAEILTEAIRSDNQALQQCANDCRLLYKMQ